MAKAAKTVSREPVRRSVRTGKFLGRTEDGILIQKPDFKPKSFTLRELDEAVRAVKRQQAAATTG
jgi:hypothetical protein